MPSRFATMSIIAAMSLIGIASYNQAQGSLSNTAANSSVTPVLTSVAEPGLQLMPLVIFGLLAITVFASIRGLR